MCNTILYIQMQFVWDERKNRLNQRKHKVSFETAVLAFRDPRAVSYLDRIVDSEERWHTIGLVDNLALLLVVHTAAEEDEAHAQEEIRIISARKATPSERRLYSDSNA